jgi:hypothetical protein
MKTVKDACDLQPNALSIKLSDQIEQLGTVSVGTAGRALRYHGTYQRHGRQ